MKRIKQYVLLLLLPQFFVLFAEKAAAQDTDDIIKQYGYVVIKEAPPRILDSVAAAYQGTWKYENKEDGIEFIVKLKCASFINMLFLERDQITISGAYKITRNGEVIEDNLSCLDCLKNETVLLTGLNHMLFYKAPIRGGTTFPRNLPFVPDFIFRDRTTKKESKLFYIRTDSMNSSNNRLYWDFSDRNYNWLANEGCIIMTREQREEELRREKAGFTVPEKCVLTRVSHSVYDD